MVTNKIVRNGYVYHDTLMKYDTKVKAQKAVKFRKTIGYASIVVKKKDYYAVYNRIKLFPDFKTA